MPLRYHWIKCLLPLSGLVLLLGCDAQPAVTADRIFYNGKIVTVDESFSVVSALAVKDGQILAVGNDIQIKKLADADTALVDLSGKMMLPGLIDSHTHPNQASVSEFDHPIPDMRSIPDVLGYVRARAEALPAGEWIWVRTVFSTRLQELRYPNKAELDSAAPRHPVIFVNSTGAPVVSLNSAALDSLGINREFIGMSPTDVEKDPTTGEPTGLIRNYQRYIKDAGGVDKTNAEQRTVEFKNMMRLYNAVGLTTVSDRKADAESIEMYRGLREQGALTVRLALMHYLDISEGREFDEIAEEISRIASLPSRGDDSMLRLIGIKTFLDGGILSGSAYMLEPWGLTPRYAITDPEYRGKLAVSPQRLANVVRATVESGLQYTAHAVGDGAVTALLEAYDSVNDVVPIASTRPSVTHANFMSPWVIAKMAELGVVADIQPAWLHLDAHMLMGQFGDERLRYFQPLQSLFEAGVVVGGGSDHWHLLEPQGATNPYDPFLGMWIAVTRNARFHDQRIHPEEALTREQALRFYTTNNAYLLFLEDQVGSLEPGKFADMIVVDRDILDCEADALRDTQVLQTYLNGDLVYDAND